MTSFCETRRTLLAFSPGGHFAELERALEGIDFDDRHYLTFRSARPLKLAGPVHFVAHPRRQVGATLVNFWQSYWLLRRLRPQIVISTGADVAVPVFVLARCFGIPTIFIETGGSLEPTLAGRLCYRFADLFIVQWPERLQVFPRAQLADGLLL